MQAKKLIERIDFGDDVAFVCGGKHFVVCQTDDGCDIAERETCKNRAIFPDGETLINEYMIDGRPIKERINEVRFESC